MGMKVDLVRGIRPKIWVANTTKGLKKFIVKKGMIKNTIGKLHAYKRG